MGARDDYPMLAVTAASDSAQVIAYEAIKALGEIDQLRAEVDRLNAMIGEPDHELRILRDRFNGCTEHHA